jgi:hypothetical protein
MSLVQFKATDLGLLGSLFVWLFSTFGILYKREFMKDDERLVLMCLYVFLKKCPFFHQKSSKMAIFAQRCDFLTNKSNFFVAKSNYNTPPQHLEKFFEKIPIFMTQLQHRYLHF